MTGRLGLVEEEGIPPFFVLSDWRFLLSGITPDRALPARFGVAHKGVTRPLVRFVRVPSIVNWAPRRSVLFFTGAINQPRQP